jgi:tetratricopeptide (TPR) repeat protein
MALMALRRYELAIASFDQALRHNPNSAKTWDKRGTALLQLGRNAEAINSFKKALEINPKYAAAYYHQASCYALQGQSDAALETLQKAIDLDPKLRQQARTDVSFEELWDDRWFRSLIAP